MNNKRSGLTFRIILMIVALVGIAFYLGRTSKQTLSEAIASGNVKAMQRILNWRGYPRPYLVQAMQRPTPLGPMYYFRHFARLDRPFTDKEIEHRNELSYTMVKLLVEHGADIDETIPSGPYSGGTPIMRAIGFDIPEVVRYLLEQGASVNVFDDKSRSPLMYASRQLLYAPYDESRMRIRNLEFVKMLLDYNAKETINHVDIEGNSALHITDDFEIAKLLLDNGADPTIRNNAGQTPLEHAREYNMKSKATVIEKYMNADGNRASEAAPEILPENQGG